MEFCQKRGITIHRHDTMWPAPKTLQKDSGQQDDSFTEEYRYKIHNIYHSNSDAKIKIYPELKTCNDLILNTMILNPTYN